MKIEDFKAGDRIYQTHGGHARDIMVVERITPTQIVCNNNVRFRIKYDRLDLIGSGTWNFYSYSRETPELKEEYEKKVLKSKIDRVINKLNYNKASYTDLCSIYEIVSKYDR